MIWLDGNGNQVGKPNENLAREFMELFSLGVGNYTEQDVRQAAMALTGWRVNYTTDAAGFRAEAPTIQGPETVLGQTAPYDAYGLVNLLVTQPASPRYLATRVWTRFVSDTPPDKVTMDQLLAAYGPGHDVTALVPATVRRCAPPRSPTRPRCWSANRCCGWLARYARCGCGPRHCLGPRCKRR